MLNRIKNSLLALWIVFLFSGCVHIYTPVLYHNDIAYQPKPASFDSVKTARYFSVAYRNYENVRFEDNLSSGEINLTQAHAFRKFNISYGSFADFGRYKNMSIQEDQPNYFKILHYGVIGARASANLISSTEHLDFRYIGFEAAYSHEFGDFSVFKKTLYNQGACNVDPRVNLLTLGLSSEVIFHNHGNTLQQAIRFFLGETLGYNALNKKFYPNTLFDQKSYRTLFPKLSYFIKYKNYFGLVDVGTSLYVGIGRKF